MRPQSTRETVPPVPAGARIDVYLWDMICCYAQHHTPQAALAKLPKSQRAKVKAALKANEPNWWDTADIWKQWPALIDHLGLIPKGPLHYGKVD